ncbi:MAG: adenylate/guanylate cyclase domain-containing protein, partial [Gordonia sp. (in: high G+C Gram-positive bacteria)]
PLVRPAERWATGHDVDPYVALQGTYEYVRRIDGIALYLQAMTGLAYVAVVGAVCGASAGNIAAYAAIGLTSFAAVYVLGGHSLVEAGMRPARVALTGDTTLGDALPRATPTFAQRSNRSLLAAAYTFTMAGGLVTSAFDKSLVLPVIALLVAVFYLVVFAVPITVGSAFAPSMRPIRDLTEGANRVAAGDYSQRLPVLNDDDLGVLSATFNRMQQGLAERRRLHTAFGTYVDPALAARLLEQGDDIFRGEHRHVTTLFIDIRDFTAYADSHTAEEAVSRLNELFAIVVPAVVEAGGHVNKYLGDGALAVFGAPGELDRHADAAVTAAIRIRNLVADTFADEVHIGIGLNTGEVIVGTIGGGGKLEYTLIGDAVNVAARVEQLTKTTGDTILLTGSCAQTLANPVPLVDRGRHEVKGKPEPVQVYALAD